MSTGSTAITEPDLRGHLGVWTEHLFPRPMPDTGPPTPRPVTPVRALALFVVYTIAFAVGGGLAAGIMALVFAAVSPESYDSTVYAVTFGVTGFIAYRLAQRVAEG